MDVGTAPMFDSNQRKRVKSKRNVNMGLQSNEEYYNELEGNEMRAPKLEVTENTEELTQPQPNPDVDLFNALIQFIDIVTQRGALRGEELLNVGIIRQRLT